MNFRKIKKDQNPFVEPDEIFLDSKNLENFNRQQFEGRIEKPIPRRTINFLGAFFLLMVAVFGTRLTNLQIVNGETYRKRSEDNTLERRIIFTDRGIIYDRNKVELAWNKKIENSPEDSQENPEGGGDEFALRTYLSPGFSHVLGYVNYPAKDSTGRYWQTEMKGIDGLEKEYDSAIKGENGSKIIEISARGAIHSENIVNEPKQGDDLLTSLDSRVQKQLFLAIKNLAENYSFTGGAGIIMDVRNGEIIASTSFPEYDSEVLSLGKDRDKIRNYTTDKRKFFLDRTISGLYTPGSIVKPILGIGALTEGVIDPLKKILSTGSISIPNPYFPGQETVFKDWRVNGWTNMAEAIALSSDVYFYEIGGGFENQKGMGIANIEKYAKLFGIGSKTGVDLPDETSGTIPNPEWKAKNFKGDIWRVGDTYNTAIGQYGFQVTPMEMARAISAIANYGKLPTPHFILGDKEKEGIVVKFDLPKEHFDVIHEGMRMAVTEGTAAAINVPYVKAAAKTGTAQIGVAKNRVNSWIVGFFPYEEPKYAFTVMMESGPSNNVVSASTAMRTLFDWMSLNTPEYFE